ncbi:universal stress protein [Phormidium sp. LEGE 05292]|uniref:universal stress protein n=1 Tax=[Phormidium] sp. LEGE 05292 TaxID=767427 RepID=UPI0018824E95|nr:universal stress protein [Phormidium sp. LEGE 05292]MBE9224854.1 universal stress protein [Phormidium sp. LEGE 05292]
MKILVAIDRSEISHKALEQALSMINHQDTTFLLLGIEEPVMIPSMSPLAGVLGEDPGILWQEETELVKSEEQQAKSTIQWAENLCHQKGVTFKSRLEFGEPKDIICDVAQQENSDLIVIGSHGYGVIERVLLGSVTDHVVHHAHCAVLVVRE